jgi:hypothetical protein
MTLHFVSDGDPDIEEAWDGDRCYLVIHSEQGWGGFVIKFPEDKTPVGVMEYSFDGNRSTLHVDEARQQLEQYAGSLPHK